MCTIVLCGTGVDKVQVLRVGIIWGCHPWDLEWLWTLLRYLRLRWWGEGQAGESGARPGDSPFQGLIVEGSYVKLLQQESSLRRLQIVYCLPLLHHSPPDKCPGATHRVV